MSSRGRCCCRKGCWLWTDDFDRATIGGDWDQVAGEWSIVDALDEWGFPSGHHTVREAGNVDALLIMDFDAVPAPMYHVVQIHWHPLPDGAKPRCIVNYDPETGNHYFAQYEVRAPTGIITIWRHEDGVDTLLDTLDPAPGSFGLYVCFNDRYFAASTGTADDYASYAYKCFDEHTARFENGDRAGLGNGSTDAITFGLSPYNESNDPVFYIEEMWSLSEPSCPHCLCTCGPSRKCMPRTLLATYTLENAGEGCDYEGLHGYEHLLTGGGDWTGTASICGFTWDVRFGCIEKFGPNQQELVDPDSELFFGSQDDFYPGVEECEGQLPFIAGAASITCDPLSIVFGPFLLESPEPPPLVEGCVCCESGESNNLWITITMPP